MKGQQSNSTPTHYPHTNKNRPTQPPTKLTPNKVRSGTTKIGNR